MESINISFTVKGQDLVGDCPFLCASNTVSYIIAEFDLDDNWKEFDSVRAVWRTDSECISTVLDNNGNCNVPQEVLKRKNEVIVNLVGSVVEDNELTERLTTYPVVALIVDATALICGTETAEVTPSQFEQYIAQVIAEVEKVTGMTAVAVPLPEGSDPTASYEDGVLTLGIPKGEKGDTGNGIERVEFNSDYSLTFYFTESEPYTTPSIRGARGAQGYGIVSVEKKGSVGLVDTYQVNYENPEIEPTTFTVTNGAKGDTGNGIESAVLNDDYTLTLTFTDGTEYTTPSIRGEQGEPGEVTLAQFASAFPTDTASGAIASFPDGSDLFDYLSCIVDIEPVQDLHGYDKPWVGGAGANKWDEQWEVYGGSGQIRSKNAIPLTEGATYYAKTSIGLTLYFKETPTGTTITSMGVNNEEFTVPQGCHYAMMYTSTGYGSTYKHDIAINYPSSITTYSPWQNICPITGWTGCEVDVSGVNVWDEQWELGSLTNGGANYPGDSQIRSKNYIPVMPSTTYHLHFPVWCPVYWFDGDKNLIERIVNYGTDYNVTSPNNARYMRFFTSGSTITTYNHDISINYPSTDTTYHAHNPNSAVYPVSWQTEAGTVYGGTVDLVTGVLTVTRSIWSLKERTWGKDGTGFYTEIDAIKRPTIRGNGGMKCNIYGTLADGSYFNTLQQGQCSLYNDDPASNVGRNWFYIKDDTYPTTAYFKTYIDGLAEAYTAAELATPQTYQLDPVQMVCLLGQNNVWADCGDIEEVQYKADVQKWVEKKLGE